MTWREIDRKYSSEDREDMSFERECESQFIVDIFVLNSVISTNCKSSVKSCSEGINISVIE